MSHPHASLTDLHISATPAICASQRKNTWLQQHVHTLATKPWMGIHYHTRTSLSATLLSRTKPYLGIDDEYFALRDANFQVTDFVSVTVPKTCIKWVAVLGKEVPNVLNTQWTLSRQCPQPTPAFSLYHHKVLASSDLSYSIVFECWELRREEYLKACNFEFVRSSSNNCMTSNALIRKNYQVFSHGSWLWPALNLMVAVRHHSTIMNVLQLELHSIIHQELPPVNSCPHYISLSAAWLLLEFWPNLNFTT